MHLSESDRIFVDLWKCRYLVYLFSIFLCSAISVNFISCGSIVACFRVLSHDDSSFSICVFVCKCVYEIVIMVLIFT